MGDYSNSGYNQGNPPRYSGNTRNYSSNNYSNSYSNQSRTNSILVKSIIFVGILVVLVFVGVLLYSFVGSSDGNINAAATEDKGVTLQVPVIEDIDEFKENFKECTPSAKTRELSEKVTYYYEILGPVGDGWCKVKTQAINYPVKDWIGKAMICEHDPSIEFDFSIVTRTNCKGDLFELMNNINPNNFQGLS